MLIVLPARPPVPAEARPLWGPEATPPAQGVEGQRVQEQLQQVLRHWQERSEESRALVAEPIGYRHVPFPTAGPNRVRYKSSEPLRPRRFVLEDDDL